MKRREQRREKPRFERHIVDTRRVAKVRAGDKLLSFSALVVVGDKKSKVGVGLGKGRDTRAAIMKAVNKGERKMFEVCRIGTTIPHEVLHKFGAAKILLKPAPPGTGVIAGSSIRPVLELAGIADIVTKQVGRGNAINNVYCVVEALKKLKKERVLSKRSKAPKVEETSVDTVEENKKIDLPKSKQVKTKSVEKVVSPVKTDVKPSRTVKSEKNTKLKKS